MLDDENYSSDSSDDDYVPAGVESDVEDLTEEDSNSDDDEVKEDAQSKKRKLPTKRNKMKKLKNSKHTEEDQEDKLKTCSNHEDDKQKIDSLWASFKEPVDSKEGKSSTLMVSSDVKQTASKIFEFAGEEVEVQEKTKPIPSSSQQNLTKRPPLRSGGLSSLTSQLTNKKSKLSTLEKSKLDWDRFKSDEGIAEDLKSFNQGKKGFLERQAFLERADVKQFEIEKSLRAGRKPNQH